MAWRSGTAPRGRPLTDGWPFYALGAVVDELPTSQTGGRDLAAVGSLVGGVELGRDPATGADGHALGTCPLANVRSGRGIVRPTSGAARRLCGPALGRSAPSAPGLPRVRRPDLHGGARSRLAPRPAPQSPKAVRARRVVRGAGALRRGPDLEGWLSHLAVPCRDVFDQPSAPT